MRHRLFTVVGWVTADTQRTVAGWTATLHDEHPSLTRIGSVTAADVNTALVDLRVAITRCCTRHLTVVAADGEVER